MSKLKPALRDESERNRLVLDNIKLVDWVVGQMIHSRAVRVLGMDDAIQCGRLGLMRAADLWDPKWGFLFSTYAVHAIRHSIVNWADDFNIIHVPSYARQEMYNGKPVREEIRNAAKKALKCKALPHRVVGKHEVFFGDCIEARTEEYSKFLQVTDSPSSEETKELVRMIAKRARMLPNCQASAIRRCLLGNQTIYQAAEARGVTHQAVRQALKEGKEDLREWLLQRGVGA